MKNYREVDEKRQELDDLIAQAERRLTMQIDPYMSSRRGIDFGEDFYDLRKQLADKIFSETALESSEVNRSLNQNVEDIIGERYEGILRNVLYSGGVQTFEETKHYVVDSHSNMLQQVQVLMQSVRDIISAKNTPQIADGAKLLEEADRLIGQTDMMLATHKVKLATLQMELEAYKRKSEEEEKRKQEEEQGQEQTDPLLAGVDKLLASTDEMIAEQKGNLASIENQLKMEEQARQEREKAQQTRAGSLLESVDELLASTDEMIVAQRANLAALENQLRGYIKTHSAPEEVKSTASPTSEKGQTDIFRLSDEDMEHFNQGVKKVMDSINGSAQDRQQQGKDLTSGSTQSKPSRAEDLLK